MKYRIDRNLEPGFCEHYQSYLLNACGHDELPNPKGAKHGILHNYRPWEYYQVLKHGDFGPHDEVLDTGAMHSYFCIYLSQFVRRIYATDNFFWAQRNYVEKQRLFSPQQWMIYVEAKGEGRIKGEYADMMGLPYAQDTFDKVLCVSTIEHVLDDFKGIRELARVLRPSGKLLLTTEFNFYIGQQYSEANNSYLRVYTSKSLGELISHSGLQLTGDIVLASRNYLLLRRKVNAFVCLTKS